MHQMESKLEQSIYRLLKLVKSKEFTKEEDRAFAREITRINSLLLEGEYNQLESKANTFNIPERTREFYSNLQSYNLHIATWQKIFFAIEANTANTIIDLCCGWAPKQALALWHCEYAGELILIDKDQESQNALIKFMQFFKPKYTISPHTIDLINSNVEKSGNIVIANHIADDFVIEIASRDLGFSTKDLYEKEGEYIRICKLIASNSRDLKNKTSSRLAEIIISTVKPGGNAILTQYLSYMEKLLGLSFMLDFSNSIIKETINILCQHGFTPREDLSKSALKDFEGVFQPSECHILYKTI